MSAAKERQTALLDMNSTSSAAALILFFQDTRKPTAVIFGQNRSLLLSALEEMAACTRRQLQMPLKYVLRMGRGFAQKQKCKQAAHQGQAVDMMAI
jgi:hypothetical protein